MISEIIKLKDETEIVKIKEDKGVSFEEAGCLHKNNNDLYKALLMTQAMNDKSTSEVEEIIKTIMHEIKINEHITPEIKMKSK